MCCHQYRATKQTYVFHHHRFIQRIKVASCFIQYQQLRLAIKCSREHYPLALTTGEPPTAWTNFCVNAKRQHVQILPE